MFRDTEIYTVKEELSAIYSNRGMGDTIPSRVQWWEGQKSTKYFNNLEKAQGKDVAWHKIKDKNGQLVYGTSRIQECQVHGWPSTQPNRNTHNLAAHHRAAHNPAVWWCAGSVVCNLPRR